MTRTSILTPAPAAPPTATQRRLQGVAALLGLLGLLGGIPAALLLVGAARLPDRLPTWEQVTGALTAPDDGRLFLSMLLVVAWVAWATFALSVLVEVVTRARGVPAPRLPALRVQQRTAAGLISAVALLFTLTPTAAAVAPAAPPAASADADPTPATAAAAPAGPVPAEADVEAASTPADPVQQDQPAGGRMYVVEAGDTLWKIAEAELGDGARFTEITRLNQGVPQADGRALDDSRWIEPGWTLRLPTAPAAATPAGGGSVVVERGDTLSRIAAEELGEADRWPEVFDASDELVQADGRQLTDPDLIFPGWRLALPDQPPSSAVDALGPVPTAGVGGPPAPAAATADDVGGSDPAVPTGLDEPAGSDGAVAAEPDGRTAAVAQEAAAPDGDQRHGVAGPHRALDVDPAPLNVAGDADAPAGGEGTPAAVPAAPPTGVDGPGTAAGERPAQTASQAPAQDEGDEDVVSARTAAGVGSLLAAGVIALIADRRRRQQQRRTIGQPLAMPTGSAAAAERDLRGAANPLGVALVDRALRSLAASCAHSGQPLPTVRAGRLTAEAFELFLTDPATLPDPWVGTVDATVWTLPADLDDTDLLPAQEAADVPAPYPSLVVVGHDVEDGHVLLDLEHVGALGVVGPADQARDVLTAVAVELATSRWADDLQLTFVGAHAALPDALGTGRLRHVPTVGRLLDDLSARAERDREVLAREGAEDLQHARADGTAPGVWTPEIVLLPDELTDDQRHQLTDLVSQLPRVAVAAVTTGTPVGEWALRLDGDSAVLDPVGLQLAPQRLDPATTRDVLDVLAVADEQLAAAEHWPQGQDTAAGDVVALPARPEPATDELPAVPSGDAGEPEDQEQDVAGPAASDDRAEVTGRPADGRGQSAASVLAPLATAGPDDDGTVDQRADDARLPAAAAVGEAGGEVIPQVAVGDGEGGAQVHTLPLRGPRVLLLGPATIEGATGPLNKESLKRLTELAAFLVCHPGTTAAALDEALWPGRRVSTQTRNTLSSRLRRWLGPLRDGEDAYPRWDGDGYRLHPEVRTDWQQWQQLLPDGPVGAPTERLEQALRLVRGRPFGDAPAPRYAWAEPLAQEMISAVVDAAHELARRRLRQGAWRAADTAATTGLLVEPGMEALWRLRLRALHGAGNAPALLAATARLTSLFDDLGIDLEEDTERLLTQLHPAPARTPVAATAP